MTAGIVGDIRGKDSPLNHGLGAFAGGCILATRCEYLFIAGKENLFIKASVM